MASPIGWGSISRLETRSGRAALATAFGELRAPVPSALILFPKILSTLEIPLQSPDQDLRPPIIKSALAIFPANIPPLTSSLRLKIRRISLASFRWGGVTLTIQAVSILRVSLCRMAITNSGQATERPTAITSCWRLLMRRGQGVKPRHPIALERMAWVAAYI